MNRRSFIQMLGSVVLAAQTLRMVPAAERYTFIDTKETEGWQHFTIQHQEDGDSKLFIYSEKDDCWIER